MSLLQAFRPGFEAGCTTRHFSLEVSTPVEMDVITSAASLTASVIEEFEDMIDVRAAMEALAEGGEPISLEKLKAELGIE